MVIHRFSTYICTEMWITSKTSDLLKRTIEKESVAYCSGLFLSARWFVFSQVAEKGTHVIIMPDSETAEYCAADLYGLIQGDCIFYLPASGKNIEKSNYKSSLGVQRTSAVGKIIDNKNNDSFLIVVTYPEALEELVPAASRIEESILELVVGEEIPHDEIRTRLAEMGFEKVDFVSAPGQYAVRGSIIDIFSYSFNDPFRVSFFGNEIEKINVFDCNTQLSKEVRERIEIIPDLTLGNVSENRVGNDLETGIGKPIGNIVQTEDGNDMEILDILPSETVLWLDSPDMYKGDGFYSETGRFKRVFIDTPIAENTVNPIRFNISPQPVFNKNFELLAEDIKSRMEAGFKVTIFGEKESQLDRVKDILYKNGGLMPDFISGQNIHSGFIDNEDKICCYSDHEIFDRYHRVAIRRSVEKSEQLTLNDLNAFNIGDYIVHIDHGVGIFGGLVRMKDDKGRYHEVVKLMYKDNDVVFVSVHSLHKIARYKSKESTPPKINKLGSKTWTALKNNTKSKVKDIAKELIHLYAKRKAADGFAFSADTYLQEELESSFMYEDTYDQQLATAAVKKDMEESSPMDRLICGDVGFGKTEIAIRAAFKAVADSKQVAVLVPTTILALQHFKTFTSRLEGFPCNIDYVSRLRTAKETTEIKKNLKEGKIDILIGTHKILGKGFDFKDLGLLVIDEEQKFGVGAKEKLRQLKLSVDTLTLTATPIPRTLQFSLLGARDLSIISTPPPNRIPVQTEIILFDEEEIKGIINYELKRGGQIFFLHNRVEQLDSIRDILQRLVPDMKICVAHGQMESKVLETKMLDFMNGDYDMLLCTTIIESGIDIPNANTIIINQAQNFGLSDLHQLRGRVGRSNKRAFCYLIVPPMTTISDDSRRRLKAIEEFSDLGSGFSIAMQDLDIRGAGNLLGAEQSGFIADMGYETYQKILAEAMDELGMETGIVTQSHQDKYVEDCSIETDQVALIPDTYIDIPAEKLRIYKELDSFTREKELEQMADRLSDRFGPIPEELMNLFQIVRIRQLGEKLGFEKIIIKNGILIAFFVSNPMSAYFRSSVFSKVLEKISAEDNLFELKQNGSKLRVVSRNIDSVSKAYKVLKKISI